MHIKLTGGMKKVDSSLYTIFIQSLDTLHSCPVYSFHVQYHYVITTGT